MSGKNASLSLTDNQLTRLVRESAHQVWLAGLGAYARAEAEGSRLFDGLVSVGERIEQGARDQVARRMEAAEERVTGARQTALLTWDRLERMVEHQIAATLNRLQIPTSRDIRELARRVETLQATVERLETEARPRARQAAGRKPAAASKSAARKKAGAKPAARKKAAARKSAPKAAASRGRPASVRSGAGSNGRRKPAAARAGSR